jgi:N-acetylglucosaminyldiphosphoundecaprenol N-acetyl-beta-D-mannosaminyltransferase
MTSSVDIMGCRFDAITEAETRDLIFEWRDAPERKTHTIITVNVAILMMMRDDPKLSEAVEKADLVVVDGTPLVWTAKWLAKPVPEKVSGVDLMQQLLEVGEKDGKPLRVFLLGTTQERLDKLCDVIRDRYPKVVIAGARNGYFKEPDWPDVTKLIRESNADVLFVGMPCPFKEIWCERHREELATPAVIGVGGAFDVLGGFVQRAPVVMQKAGMEWFWRMMMEPRKLFKRYLVTNSQFMALLAKALVTGRVLKRAD